MDKRDDNFMATGYYPPRRRPLWKPLLEIVIALLIAFLTCLGARVVWGWFAG